MEKKESKVIEKVKGLLREKDVLVSSPKSIEELSSKGYGTPENGKLALNFYEALFLLSKNLLEVKDQKTGKNIDFQSLLQHFRSLDENAWVKYLIYRDLKSRGYVVREGFGLGIDFRVYERGEYGKETAKYLIFGILEGRPTAIEELTRVLKHVESLKKKLILAVINRKGEVVYYALSHLTLT